IWEANPNGAWALARTITAEPALLGWMPSTAFPFLVPQMVCPRIRGIGITPDGKQLCAYVHSAPLPKTMLRWNLTDGTPIARFIIGPAVVQNDHLAVSLDGKLVASDYFRSHGRVLVWRLDTGRPVRDLSDELWRGVRVCFSPDGKFLACSGFGV